MKSMMHNSTQDTLANSYAELLQDEAKQAEEAKILEEKKEELNEWNMKLMQETLKALTNALKGIKNPKEAANLIGNTIYDALDASPHLDRDKVWQEISKSI